MRIILLALLLTSCVSPVFAQSPVKPVFPLVERATLRFRSETLSVPSTHAGTATLKRQTSRAFTFDLPEGTQELYLTTCHRELAFYKPNSIFSYQYQAAMSLLASDPLEYAGNCMLIATAITEKGKVLRGLVSFSGDEDAPAQAFCDVENGRKVVGHYLCQSRASLTQAFVFDDQMHATWKDNCAPLRTKDNKGFSLELSPGLCTYAFQSFDTKKSFRLTTYGYTNISLPDYED